MGSFILIGLLIGSLLVISSVQGSVYIATATRLNNEMPFFTSQKNQSSFLWNYNTAYVPLSATQDGLMIRVQNPSINKTQNGAGPSSLAFARFLDSDNLAIENVDSQSVMLSPEEPWELLGVEDPRVAYRALDGTYFMLYTAVQATNTPSVIARLSLAIADDPTSASSWKRMGPIFPDCANVSAPNCTGHILQWSKSGAMIIRDGFDGPHYLMFGDSSFLPGIQLATSIDLFNWDIQPGIFLPVRGEEYFDSFLVESGPPPIMLSDGNYFWVYNSAKKDNESANGLQYHVGWLVLNGSDPTQIIQRCEEPLLSPQLPWEIGTSPWLGLTPNVVFCEGMRTGHQPDTFVIYYGAADSVLGAAEVVVSISS